ncbi:MAG: DUF5329 family protein [Salinivirgaceae bacterium]
MIRTFLLFLFSFILLCSNGQEKQQKPLSEEEKITYLIRCVEQLNNATFIRNGVSHDAKAAAAHMRMKHEKAGKRIKTVEQFIDKVASQSSITGEPYQIVYADGKRVVAKTFYQNCLKKIEAIPSR